MFKRVLVKQLISEGEELLRTLEQSGFPMTSAYWLHLPEDPPRWRLIIATPLVNSEGPLAAYRRIQEALPGTEQRLLSLTDVSAVSPDQRRFHDILNELQGGQDLLLAPPYQQIPRCARDDNRGAGGCRHFHVAHPR